MFTQLIGKTNWTKPAFDIATFGTSLTWLSLFQPGLVRAFFPQQVEVYNLGSSGSDSTWGAANTSRVTKLRPQVALIEFCINDCVNLSLSAAETKTIQILDAIRAVVPDVYLMTMNPVVGSGGDAVARASLASYHEQYRDIALAEGVPIIDIAPLWSGATLTEIPDGLHPTRAACNAITVPAIVAALS